MRSEKLQKRENVSSVQFSHSVMSDSLWPHESQHARPPYPSLTPRVYSNSCPSTRWYHPGITSSVVPFSSCPQSLPASGSFPMSLREQNEFSRLRNLKMVNFGIIIQLVLAGLKFYNWKKRRVTGSKTGKIGKSLMDMDIWIKFHHQMFKIRIEEKIVDIV